MFSLHLLIASRNSIMPRGRTYGCRLLDQKKGCSRTPPPPMDAGPPSPWKRVCFRNGLFDGRKGSQARRPASSLRSGKRGVRVEGRVEEGWREIWTGVPRLVSAI
jgi:hypothetical protein